MNFKYNDKIYPSLSEYIHFEKDNSHSLYGKRLEFAHEIDSSVINALNEPHVQNAVNKFADLLVNFQSGTEISSGIVIDSYNFPEINDVLKHCCKTLGIKIPHAVVSARMPGINAYASGTADNPYLLISDLATHLLSKEELTFIIGHECGHIAMEHLVYHLIGNSLFQLGKLLPIIGPMLAQTVSLPIKAWSRYSEITADRAGFLCCGDLKTSQRALMKLESAFANVSDVDLDVYIEQSLENLENMKLGAIKEYFFDHPLTPKRLKALQYFSQSAMYYRITGKEHFDKSCLLPDDTLKEKVNNIIKIL